jgi:hypothetical protein
MQSKKAQSFGYTHIETDGEVLVRLVLERVLLSLRDDETFDQWLDRNNQTRLVTFKDNIKASVPKPVLPSHIWKDYGTFNNTTWVYLHLLQGDVAPLDAIYGWWVGSLETEEAALDVAKRFPLIEKNGSVNAWLMSHRFGNFGVRLVGTGEKMLALKRK